MYNQVANGEFDELGVWDEGRPKSPLNCVDPSQSAPPVPERPSCSSKHKSCSDHHYQLVDGYRLARLAWEQEKDRLCADYGEEGRLYNEAVPGPNFKQWLVGQRGSNREGA